MTKNRLASALTALFVLQFLHGLAPAPKDASPEGGWTGLIGGLGFLLATVLAWHWVRRDDRRGRPLAFILGLAIPVGFVLYHGAWFTSPVTNPYWGDGSATGLQWLSVVAVGLCGFFVSALAAPSRAEERAAAA